PTPVLQAITISPDNATMAGGGQQPFSAGGQYRSEECRVGQGPVEWGSSAPDEVSIDTNGLATAGAVSGTATITATDPSSGIRGRARAAVPAADQQTEPPPAEPPPADKPPAEQPPTPVLQAITISPDNATMAGGGQQPFSAGGQY